MNRRVGSVVIGVLVLVGSLSFASGSPAGGATPGFEPFPSWTGLVTRVYTDLMATAPSSSVRSTWVADLDGGSKTKGDLVDSLRRGSENTTNVDPATRLYRAFMGLPADPSGVDFWTGKLDAGKRSRGTVMVGFSESSEYRNTQRENVDVAVAYIFLLNRAPNTAEVTD